MHVKSLDTPQYPPMRLNEFAERGMRGNESLAPELEIYRARQDKIISVVANLIEQLTDKGFLFDDDIHKILSNIGEWELAPNEIIPQAGGVVQDDQ